MSDALSDRVTYWFTMNEPQCFFSDFLEMVNMQERDIAAKQVYRNILLSHGLAVKALRSGAMRPLKIGMVIMGLAVEPVPGALDENQAMHMMFSDLGGYMGMARWLDPIMDGTCPNAVSDILTPAMASTMKTSGATVSITARLNPAAMVCLPKAWMALFWTTGFPATGNGAFAPARTLLRIPLCLSPVAEWSGTGWAAFC